MTQEVFDELMLNGESETLDYKEISYFANVQVNTKKDKDADFIKDILAFANTVREESSYIIIGVKEANGVGVPVGIGENDSIDNSILQAKIKDKVSPIPKFSCFPFYDKDGKRFDIIEIPVTWYSTPCVSTVTMGNLERNQVYLRRDSCNEKAGVDEIARLLAWLSSLPKLAQVNSKAKEKAKFSNSGFKFDEETIQKLFGNEAAEDENIKRLKEYYFKNDTFGKISVDLPLRILVGHKGVGKSALFKVAISEDKDSGKLPILVKPDDVSSIAKGESQEFNDIVKAWKRGLYQIILKKTFTAFGIRKKTEFELDELYENFIEILVDELNMANENGFISSQYSELVESFLDKPILNIYIDDLDRGWLGGNVDIIRISALLNAVRDITNDNRELKFRISLRSDVYFLVRTSDESTDKIQSSVIWYRWSYHEILCLLVKRVSTFFGKEVDEKMLRSLHQGDIAKNLSRIIEPNYSGIGKWENKEMYKVLLSVVRKRPRDLVKLLTLAARNANSRGSNYIMSQDLQNIFDEYSLDRIQDTINEYKSELPNIERLIFGMKPDKRTRVASESFYYTTADLLKKINNIRERGEFRFSNGSIANAKEIAAFLYKINFLTATKKLPDDFIERKDFEENRYLAPKFEDFGYDWEVHMAFRWGLQPSNQINIFSLI